MPLELWLHSFSFLQDGKLDLTNLTLVSDNLSLHRPPGVRLTSLLRSFAES